MGPIQGDRCRYRDDLCADDFIELPAKAVIITIFGDHLGGGQSVSVTGQTVWILDSDGPGNKQHIPGQGMAHTGKLRFVGILAKISDCVRLPVQGTIDRVGGIQGRLLVGLLRVDPAYPVEDPSCRVGRHGLRQKGLLHLRGQQGPDFFDGIATDGLRHFHHNPGI